MLLLCDCSLTRCQARRGAKVVVIHLGSRFLRIGRASDVTPLTIPNVVARKQTTPVASRKYVVGISRPREDRRRSTPSITAPGGDEYAVAMASDDPVRTHTVTYLSKQQWLSVRAISV